MMMETPVADWSVAPLVAAYDGAEYNNGRTPGARKVRAGGSTRIEGSGRFVGSMSSTRRDVGSESRGDGVTLNFVNVPVPQAAKVVLGEIMATEYIVDPKIDGKLNIHTPHAVPRKRALDLFQSALKTVNATLVQAGSVYKIVAADQAAASGVGSISVDQDDAAIGEHGNVVQLKYVSASEIKRVLDPLAPKGGVVRADDARGVLILNGSPQELATLKDAIRLFDVDTMRGMSFGLVSVRSSEPDQIADQLKNIFGSESGGPMNGMVKFVPNKRLKSILIISQQPKYLARAEDWVRRLDARALGAEKQFYTYVVQNRPAKELAGVLNSMFAAETSTSNARQVSPREAIARASSETTSGGSVQAQPSAGGVFGALSGLQGGSDGVRTMGSGGTLRAASLQRDEIPATPAGALGEDSRMRISADEGNNSLLIMASPQDYARLLRAIQNLDIAPNQVLLEATIAEVSLNDQLNFGVRYYLAKKASSGTFTDALSGAVTSVFPGFSYALKLANVNVTLNALQQITDVNVISSPSLMVRDNKTAVLQVGDQVPITTQSAVSVVTPGAPVVNSVTYKDTGVILSITPRINDSGLVMLDIEQEVSSVVPTTTSGIDSPTIQQRRVKTSVAVNDHESITLGGLVQDKQTVGRTQIPVIGDLPLLGNAFKSKNDLSGKTELIIIITPKVVRDGVEARLVTDEYRQRLNYAFPRPRTSHRPIERTVKRLMD